jgi:hypothetical protein
MNTAKPVTVSVPREKMRKLWDWCRAHSEDGRVNVAVLRSSDYSLMRDERRVRIGRAVPTVRVRHRWDYETGRQVISHSDISWSYVY